MAENPRWPPNFKIDSVGASMTPTKLKYLIW